MASWLYPESRDSGFCRCRFQSEHIAHVYCCGFGNSYADPFIEKKVVKRIQAVDPNFTCPCQRQSCSEARSKYDQFSRYLLHPFCLRAE